MKIKFTKMHGLGNDFVLIDARKIQPLDWKELSLKLLDRRFGIGGDQLLILKPSTKGDATMLIYERDGLETEMCGNGIRCVGRYLNESGLKKSEYAIDTLGGLKRIRYESPESVTVDMGEPAFGKMWGKVVDVSGQKVEIHELSMGNPHAVVFVESETKLSEVLSVGPKLEIHPLFPNRTNVEFVHVKSKTDLTVRVWERGAGETYACGTGACASAAAAIQTRRAESPLKIHFKRGELSVAWKPGESLWMTGPTSRVYDGEVEV